MCRSCPSMFQVLSNLQSYKKRQFMSMEVSRLSGSFCHLCYPCHPCLQCHLCPRNGYCAMGANGIQRGVVPSHRERQVQGRGQVVDQSSGVEGQGVWTAFGNPVGCGGPSRTIISGRFFSGKVMSRMRRRIMSSRFFSGREMSRM